jgi:hypothetical protein
MTYDSLPRECSGYCSGWQSFWLDHGEITGQLQPLESAFNCLRGWRDVPLRNHDAAMPRNWHDGEGIQSRFAEPSKHCMAQRVEHKISREECPSLSFDFGSAGVPVKVIDRRSQIRLSFPVGVPGAWQPPYP